MKENPRDGSFFIYFSGSLEKLEEMEFLLGSNTSDNLFELLGGGFNISDVTPDIAAIREVSEETIGKLSLNKNEIKYFCHMVQKLPSLGEGEKGHVFCFFKECNSFLNFKVSNEHYILSWHKLLDILRDGEKVYRTSTLRIIFHFLNYLSNQEFRFGVLGEKVKFMDYEF